MSATNEHTIHAVIFRHKEWYIAQCLEYDIATRAQDLKDLLYEVERMLAAHFLVAAQAGTEPFADIPKAPRRFWKMYQEANVQVTPVRDTAFPSVKRPPLELRAA